MSLDKSIIWTREQYEDFFQSLTRKLLPKFNKKTYMISVYNILYPDNVKIEVFSVLLPIL